MNRLNMLSAVFIVMTVFVGCAEKNPTTGDFMRMHAADEKAAGVEQKEIAKNWDKGLALKESGKKLVAHGEELVKAGEKEITEGKIEIEEGNRQIAEGTRLYNESEREFREKYPDLKLDIK